MARANGEGHPDRNQRRLPRQGDRCPAWGPPRGGACGERTQNHRPSGGDGLSFNQALPEILRCGDHDRGLPAHLGENRLSLASWGHGSGYPHPGGHQISHRDRDAPVQRHRRHDPGLGHGSTRAGDRRGVRDTPGAQSPDGRSGHHLLPDMRTLRNRPCGTGRAGGMWAQGDEGISEDRPHGLRRQRPR